MRISVWPCEVTGARSCLAKVRRLFFSVGLAVSMGRSGTWRGGPEKHPSVEGSGGGGRGSSMRGHCSWLRSAHVKYLQILEEGKYLLFDSFLGTPYLKESILRSEPA